jgi:hypothetical protein
VRMGDTYKQRNWTQKHQKGRGNEILGIFVPIEARVLIRVIIGTSSKARPRWLRSGMHQMRVF